MRCALASVGALGVVFLLISCASESFYERDPTYFSSRTTPDTSEASQVSQAPAQRRASRSAIIHTPELPATGGNDVAARFLVTADGPLTLGQSFIPGTLRPTERVALRLGERTLPADLAVLTTHLDGSVRHAVITAMIPRGSASRTSPALLLRTR